MTARKRKVRLLYHDEHIPCAVCGRRPSLIAHPMRKLDTPALCEDCARKAVAIFDAHAAGDVRLIRKAP